MRIDCVDDLDQFDELKDEWNTVYMADPHATIFVSWAWLRGWFEATPYEWFVLAVRPDSAAPPVAFLALSVDAPRHQLQMGGNPWADYTGFVCTPEHQEEAIRTLAVFVQRQLQWDRFHMRDVYDPRLELFLACFPQKGFHVQRNDGVSCPYIPLPDTWEQYLQDYLGRRTRKNLRRCMRLMDDRGEFRVTQAQEDNIERQVDAFLTLYQMRWGAQPEYALTRFRSIFRHCFESGSLWLTVLWDGDTPVSAMAGLVDRRKKVFSNYLVGRDDRFAHLSPGDALIGYSIRCAIENGFQVFDFLRGAEHYKFSFGAKERLNSDTIITRKSLRLTAKKLMWRLRCILASE